MITKAILTGKDYFYLLDSTTGKLIVIRGREERFTFPALGQNNDSSSSPIVITCNCAKAIYWGGGGTRGVSAMKIIIGKGGVLGALGDPLGEESAGGSWSPRTFHTQSGERAASSPWPRGKTDGGDVRRVGVKERGGSATPQEKKKPILPPRRHTAHRAVPRRGGRCAHGDAQRAALCQGNAAR